MVISCCICFTFCIRLPHIATHTKGEVQMCAYCTCAVHMQMHFTTLCWTLSKSPCTHTPSLINTHNRSKIYIWIYHGMHWSLCYRSKLYHTEKQRIQLPVAFKKDSRYTHQNLLKLSPVSESLSPANLCMLFPHLWVREFGHISTPSERPWIETYCPNF